MKNHIVIVFDPASIDEIAANLDLRKPNIEGLSALGMRFDAANGEPFEAVLDLATAVGKTYIAAGLIDYVSFQGARNIVIVTPSRAILSKTIANFSAGHFKSIRGRETSPLVITSEDFQRGEVASALRDDDTVKLFVFTVQQLLKPKEKTSRRVRDFHEGLGQGLYQYLQSVGDLVVIADEHHAYYGPAFSNAIRELDAAALVGLTATPNTQTPLEQIIYRYPLGRAIADGLVKVPVLVGRKDDRHDTETQLADALTLLNAKREAVTRWCEFTGAQPINPVMFIVCQTIDEAEEVAEILRRPNFFGTQYEDAVLTIHSDAADEALTRLDEVEEPNSPVRAIVSVSMLKEGWDVKNIYVICALRALASQVLTEQTLGRGLRLPFGSLTGVEMLDTVEVLGHDRYEELLRRAQVLIQSLVSDRLASSVDPATGIAPVPTGDLTPAASPSAPTSSSSSGPTQLPSSLPGVTGSIIRVADIDSRKAQIAAENLAMKSVVGMRPDAAPFMVPVITPIVTPGKFSLSLLKDNDFEEVGRSLAANPDDVLRRNKIEVVQTPGGGLSIRSVAASDIIQAAVPELDMGRGKEALVDAMMNLGLVTQTASEMNAAKRLIDAFVRGLGDDAERRLSAFFTTALDTIEQVLRARNKKVDRAIQIEVSERALSISRMNSRPLTTSLYEKVDRNNPVAYEGWKNSLVAIEWFDSDPERQMAVLLDEARDHIKRWVRLHRTDGVEVIYHDQRYYPDFAAEDANGVYWLIETKADRDLTDEQVQAKKAAAEEWTQFATDSADTAHTWHYLLVGETHLTNANGNWGLLLAQAGAKAK